VLGLAPPRAITTPRLPTARAQLTLRVRSRRLRNGANLPRRAPQLIQDYNTLTGALVYQFDYDGQGRLMTVTDGDDDITHITCDALGWPMASARAFDSLKTSSNRHIASCVFVGLEWLLSRKSVIQLRMSGVGRVPTSRHPGRIPAEAV